MRIIPNMLPGYPDRRYATAIITTPETAYVPSGTTVAAIHPGNKRLVAEDLRSSGLSIPYSLPIDKLKLRCSRRKSQHTDPEEIRILSILEPPLLDKLLISKS